MRKNRKYSGEFKERVVKEYLSGEFGGAAKLAKKHGVRSSTQVKKWIKAYQEDPKNLYYEARGRQSKGGGRSKTINLENLSLQEQVTYLKMENAILKKLEQLTKEKL